MHYCEILQSKVLGVLLPPMDLVVRLITLLDAEICKVNKQIMHLSCVVGVFGATEPREAIPKIHP